MKPEDYLKKDGELSSQIADLRVKNLDLQQEILANEKDIVRLEYERTALRSDYAAREEAESIFVYRQNKERGLCGNVIKKGDK